MVYLGSKKRLAKDIVPILQQEIEYNHIDTFIDCFCGGCNIVDKIQCNMKVASDVHHGLIELMKHVQNHPEDIPEDITEDEYNMFETIRQSFQSGMLLSLVSMRVMLENTLVVLEEIKITDGDQEHNLY